MSRQEASDIIIRRRLALAVQYVTSASPEYDAGTGVVTLKSLNLRVLAPLTIKGFVWEADHPDDAHDLPEDGEWLTVAAWSSTSTVLVTSTGSDDVGFDVDGGAVLTRVSTNLNDDTNDLRDQFNADPGYSALGTASAPAPGIVSIAWSAAWPVPHVFSDQSTVANAAAGNDDVLQLVSQSGDPPNAESRIQASHGAVAYVDPFGRQIQVSYWEKTPDGADLDRWVAPDWSA